jgi:hypothetical protein
MKAKPMAIDKAQASLVAEATLWNLYRGLLAEQMIEVRLASLGRAAGSGLRSSALAAALVENLVPGDTLGLAPGDLVTRYLWGMPLAGLKTAAIAPRSRPRQWAVGADADHGLLPGSGEEQASLALGAALSSRLHGSGSITVLVDRGEPSRLRAAGKPPGWEHAAATAVALQLPLLLLTGSPAPQPAARSRGAHLAAQLPAIPVDRNDALALYRVIYESAARARSGGGPTWITCSRWPIASPDGALNAVKAAADTMNTIEPLKALEQTLRARRLLDRQHQRHLQQALDKEFALAGWPPELRR